MVLEESPQELPVVKRIVSLIAAFDVGELGDHNFQFV